MSLTNDIKEFGLDLGFSTVGVTTADPFEDHRAVMEARKGDYAFYFGTKRNYVDGITPTTIMPEGKSIISLVYDYSRCAFPETLTPHVARTYLARCYTPQPHRIHGSRVALMVDFLRANGCEVRADRLLPERRIGARSGATSFGRNNFAYAGDAGSFIILYSILVDKELEYDIPNSDIACPDGCTACMRACPTGAIEEPLRLNPNKCIAFNCWMTQAGRTPGVTDHIPVDIRLRMGQRVHGCDVCQEVCPRNRKRLKQTFQPDPFLERLAEDFSLDRMLHMDAEFYRTRVYPIMYNYIADPKYLQRNAAIALGNTGDPRYVPDLAAELDNPEEMVRGYAAWALGRMGGAQARQALEKRAAREMAAFAREEMEAALAHV